MKAILIGYGEIGKAVFNVFSHDHEIIIHDVAKGIDYIAKNGERAEILIIAIPYSRHFEKIVKSYQEKFDIKSTLVFSTTQIGTCKRLKAVHSPVEGKHPNLAESIETGKRWIGGKDERVMRFFKEAGFKKEQLRVVEKPEFTEFLKLRSTTLYGVNIEFARYSNEVARELKMSFEEVRKFDEDYNELYRKMGMPWFARYILSPPKGKLGGHCVVPNAKKLKKLFPHSMLNEILKKREDK